MARSLGFLYRRNRKKETYTTGFPVATPAVNDLIPSACLGASRADEVQTENGFDSFVVALEMIPADARTGIFVLPICL